MPNMEIVNKIINVVENLLKEEIIGEKYINFSKPIELNEQEFEILQKKLNEYAGHVFRIFGGYDGLNDIIFIYDLSNELKRIVISYYMDSNKYYIKVIELIRYPR